MQKWQWEEQQGLRYITIPHWREQGAVALFSSRQGGVSDKPYDSLNLALHVGDEKTRVLENRNRFLGLCNSSIDKMVGCEQVHGNRVMVVGPEYTGCGSVSLETAVKECDALVTSNPGLVLGTFYADCIPVFFFRSGKKSCRTGSQRLEGYDAKNSLRLPGDNDTGI
ncbi:polyphenol oxidase family protein [Syntrophomonas palmitatica]|uniref:polyphenol oxidase family protein n=1 Tax=Syntrophomonas palmitatica TaxID=402877 RepID=UPI0006D19A32|nr:laccase domain-containing protein [Syntrophomonas palmitatica]